MNSLQTILKLLFRKVSPNAVLEGKISGKYFSKEAFEKIYFAYDKIHSPDEVEGLYEYLYSEIDRNYHSSLKDKGVPVFDVIRMFVNCMLIEENGEPVFRYDQIFHWRDVSYELEEDKLVTAFLAHQDLERVDYIRYFFDWKLILGNNNNILNQLLSQGLAENHFHLNGSAPYFIMSWINLMNYVCVPQFIRKLREYDKNRMDVNLRYHVDYKESTFEVMCLQAALIRIYLYAQVKKIELDVPEDFYISFLVKFEWIDWSKIDWDKSSKIEIREILELYKTRSYYTLNQLLDFLDVKCLNIYEPFLSLLGETVYRRFDFEMIDSDSQISIQEIFWYSIYKKKIKKNTLLKLVNNKYKKKLRNIIERCWVLSLLQDEKVLLNNRINIEFLIQNLRILEGCKYDYAAFEFKGKLEEKVWCEERWLLYQMYRAIYKKEKAIEPYIDLFYTYLLLKDRIRSELVQVNGKVGFQNFSKYESRKEDFIEKTKLEPIYKKLAIEETLKHNNVQTLEARIAPKLTVKEDRDMINFIDSVVNKKFHDRYYFVYHFIKTKDTERKEQDYRCRHASLRTKIKKQALAIGELFLYYPEQGQRVHGIDGCNSELYCRPEVFGQAFRFLSGRYGKMGLGQDTKNSKKLKWNFGLTFHVGEDFYDVIDGLRAIEEAVRYLNLTYGSRLGHAIALGISPEEWYCFKNYRIIISKQDYLDNIVWLYHRIRKFKIEGMENLLLELKRKYTHCFLAIYSESIKKYENFNQAEFNIEVYYDAWKLRGDNPECYDEHIYKEKQTLDSQWDFYSINHTKPELKDIRKNKYSVLLYYLYHYDNLVNKIGQEKAEYSITIEMIQAVTKVQKAMQLELCRKGIAIESNPSSNILIGILESYGKHPLWNFYNKGLKRGNKSDFNDMCPQIITSINTDDQSVFGTSLENEYALIAASLEQTKDQNGNYIYNPEDIYHWLELIRQNGIRMRFI